MSEDRFLPAHPVWVPAVPTSTEVPEEAQAWAESFWARRPTDPETHQLSESDARQLLQRLHDVP